MNINLKIWRQESNTTEGEVHNYRLEDVDPNISFLEMLDILNNKLINHRGLAGGYFENLPHHDPVSREIISCPQTLQTNAILLSNFRECFASLDYMF